MISKKKMTIMPSENGDIVGVPIANILSEYKFEDNVLDTVGLNDGVATGINYVSGLVGKSGNFINASNSYVSINDSDSLSFTDGLGNDLPFSITLLIKISSYESANGIWMVNKRENLSTGNEYQFIIFQNQVQVYCHNATSGNTVIVAKKDFTPTLNQWYHLSCTYDGSKSVTGLKVYIDAVQSTITSSSGTYTGMSNTASKVLIGARGWAIGTGASIHETDCVRFWNKELSQEEVSAISAYELAGTDINP